MATGWPTIVQFTFVAGEVWRLARRAIFVSQGEKAGARPGRLPTTELPAE